jgi:hypothetical protein
MQFYFQGYKISLVKHGVVSRGRNFYLDTITGTVLTANDKNQLSSIIGVWHILPSSLSKKLSESGSIQTGQDIERLLNDEHHGIFIYFHGNSFDRAQYNRIQVSTVYPIFLLFLLRFW